MDALKEIKYIQNIKSSYVINNLFLFLRQKQKMNLIIYNKRLQKMFGIDIKDIKEMSGKCIIGEKNGKGKEYDLSNNLIFEGHYLNRKRNGKGK